MSYRINTEEEWNTTLTEQDIIEDSCRVYYAMVGLYLRSLQYTLPSGGIYSIGSSYYKVTKVVSVT
jgi:hypothetical protein